MEHVQDVRVQVLCEEQCLQSAAVLLHLFVVNEEDLAEPGDGAGVPVCVGVAGVGVAAHEVLRQDHDEALEHDEEQPLLVHVGRF